MEPIMLRLFVPEANRARKAGAGNRSEEWEPLHPKKRIRNNIQRAQNEARRKRELQQTTQAEVGFNLTEASGILGTRTRRAVLKSRGVDTKRHPTGRVSACYVTFNTAQQSSLRLIFDAVRSIDIKTIIRLLREGALHWVHGETENAPTNCIWMPPTNAARRPDPLPAIALYLEAFGLSANLSEEPSFIVYPTAQEFHILKREFEATTTHFRNDVSESQEWHIDNDFTYDTRSLTVPSTGERFTEVSSFPPGINPARQLSRTTTGHQFRAKISQQGTTWNHTKKDGKQRMGDDGKTGLLFEGRVFHRGPGPQHKDQRRIVVFGQLKHETELPPEPQVLTTNIVYNLAKEIDAQIPKSMYSTKRITSLFYASPVVKK